MQLCKCGAGVFILKTQECQKCYNRRYGKENRKRLNAYVRNRYVPAPILYTAAVPPVTPCTYGAIVQRLLDYRGPASRRVCPCGAQAKSWCYRGGSAYEMRDGERTWSSNITDYDALCRACNGDRDGFFERGTKTPAAALSFLSPSGGTE